MTDADLIARLRAGAPDPRPLPSGFADKLRQRLADESAPPAGRLLVMALRRSGWIRLAAASLLLHVCAVGAVGWLVLHDEGDEHVIRILPDDPVVNLLPHQVEEAPVVLAPPSLPEPELLETAADGLAFQALTVERYLRQARGSQRLRHAVVLEPGGPAVLEALDQALAAAGASPLAGLARHFANGSMLADASSGTDPVLWWGQWEASYAGASAAAPGPGPTGEPQGAASMALVAWARRMAHRAGSPTPAGTTGPLETLYAVTSRNQPHRKALLAACLLFAGEQRPSLIREAAWDSESVLSLTPVEMLVAAHGLSRVDRRHGIEFCRLAMDASGASPEWRAVILASVVAYDTP